MQKKGDFFFTFKRTYRMYVLLLIVDLVSVCSMKCTETLLPGYQGSLLVQEESNKSRIRLWSIVSNHNPFKNSRRDEKETTMKQRKGLCMSPGVKWGTAGSCQSSWPEEVTDSNPPSQSARSFTLLCSGAALNCSTGSQGWASDCHYSKATHS